MKEDTRWPEYIEYAARAFEDDSEDANAYVADFVRRWGGLDNGALEHALREGGNDDRLFAVRGLGYLRNQDVRARLLDILETEDRASPVRWESTVWLGNMGELRAVPGLCAMLTDFLPARLDDYLEHGPSIYDERRSTAAVLLAMLGDIQAIPALRSALKQVIELLKQGTTFAEAEIVSLPELPNLRSDLSVAQIERIRAALNPGTRKYLDADGKPAAPKDATGWIEETHGNPGMLALLIGYVDDLLYALGRLGAFGALTGVGVPELYQHLWMIHLVMGHLHERLIASRLELDAAWRHDRLESVIAPLAGPVLQQRFGLNEEEQAQALALWILMKADSGVEALRFDGEEYMQKGGI